MRAATHGAAPAAMPTAMHGVAPAAMPTAMQPPHASGEPGLRILFLSDSHLGFDLPHRPRVQRPRRGEAFFAAFARALAPAARGEVDLVVHGGDLFYRSRICSGLAGRVLDQVEAIARITPVVIVPGNHERSAMPLPLLWGASGIRVFDQPRSFSLTIRGYRVLLSGFPYSRRDLRRDFPALVAATGCDLPLASAHDMRLLCMHQLVETTTVGPWGYRFGDAPDVVPLRCVPGGFAAILAGHLHRAQVLMRDARGRRLPAPVLIAGSTERTSLAERDETKGTLRLDVVPDGTGRGRLQRWWFHPLSCA